MECSPHRFQWQPKPIMLSTLGLQCAKHDPQEDVSGSPPDMSHSHIAVKLGRHWVPVLPLIFLPLESSFFQIRIYIKRQPLLALGKVIWKNCIIYQKTAPLKWIIWCYFNRGTIYKEGIKGWGKHQGMSQYYGAENRGSHHHPQAWRG